MFAIIKISMANGVNKGAHNTQHFASSFYLNSIDYKSDKSPSISPEYLNFIYCISDSMDVSLICSFF